jgi:hypothetical protein
MSGDGTNFNPKQTYSIEQAIVTLSRLPGFDKGDDIVVPPATETERSFAIY